MRYEIIFALLATLFTWLMTALGASTVIFFNKTSNHLLRIMLGFSSGIMIAAVFWSLLNPAINNFQNKKIGVLIAVAGITFGNILMIITDKITEQLKSETVTKTGKDLLMLIISITTHNIPEGLAVGVAFGACNGNYTAMSAALSVALGIGIQNFPEGAAVSIPLRNYGCSKTKSFIIGQASALVEPLFGVIGAILVVYMEKILPFCLAFAAGCMLYVVVLELIPLSQSGTEGEKKTCVCSFTIGFIIMMLLDVIF